jgi:signal transduction histidine kinase/DNA-binding response OmpR family regulator/CHASE3 domain sensor protein
MRTTLERLRSIGLLTAAGAIAGLGLVSGGVYESARSQHRISMASAVIESSDRLLEALLNLETGKRGFLITGASEYLAPFELARERLPRVLNAYDRDLAGYQVKHPAAGPMPLIRRDVERTVNNADLLISDRQRAAIDEQVLFQRLANGKSYMDSLRAALDANKKAASETIRNRTARIWTLVPALVTSGLALLAVSMIGLLRRVARERKSNERSQKILADVLARSPIGVAIIDGSGTISTKNDAFVRILGLSQSVRRLYELPDTYVSGIEGHLASARAGFLPLLNSRSVIESKLSFGPHTQHVETQLFPIGASTTGKSSDVAVLIADATAQRLFEQELADARDSAEAANKAKSSFLANMSHELRTPLTAVLGYCELLEEDLEDRGDHQTLSDLKKISANARHLLGLINDVLDLSKIEASKLDVTIESVSIQGMVEYINSAAAPLIAVNRNTFEVSFDGNPREIETDEMRLRQILLNLIGNAAKFCTDGKISLSIRSSEASPDSVQFEVSDTGIGMSEETLGRLFKRFEQADASTTRKYGGTGLGLALTQALANLLGGRITAASTVGEGSRFTCILPLTNSLGNAALPAATGQQNIASVNPQYAATILVVDDDVQLLERLKRLLEREGFNAVPCSNPAEAQSTAKRLQPDAILLDVMMPVVDGWSVMQSLKADADTASIPVIMQTLLDARTVAMSLGADGYLQKPFSKSDMLMQLRKVGASGTPMAMVVDDDPQVLDRLERVMVRDGWQVHAFQDAVAALQSVSDLKPDVILVDLVMPVLTGHAFIRELKKVPAHSAIPVVILTAEDLSALDAETLSADATEVYMKGRISMADLVQRLRAYAAPKREPQTIPGEP